MAKRSLLLCAELSDARQKERLPADAISRQAFEEGEATFGATCADVKTSNAQIAQAAMPPKQPG